MSEKQKTSFRDFANEYHPARLRPDFHRKQKGKTTYTYPINDPLTLTGSCKSIETY